MGDFLEVMALIESLPLLVAPIASLIASAGIIVVLLDGKWKLPLDEPNDRSLHKRPIPRIGGVAVTAGVVVGWMMTYSRVSPWLLTATLLLALISLADDIRELPVLFRLFAHFLAAVTAVLFYAGAQEQGTLQSILLVVALVWMTNLYNFMDGADGLAGGMTLLGFSCYGLAALAEGDASMAAMAFSVAAAATGFLAFNFPPAKVFLGDCGSIPLGFLAGVLGYLGWQSSLWPAWFPLLVFSPFIVDATVTLIARMVRGEQFWKPHREHCYQRLVRMGWGHRRTAVFYYALMAGSGLLALMARMAPPAWQIATLVTAMFIYASIGVLCVIRWRSHWHASGE